MGKIKDRSLYLVITEEFCRGRTAAEVARRAITGGVDIVQMREKDRPFDELVAKGRELLSVCKEKGVPFIVNDDPALARDIGADGVHLGQEDLQKFPVSEVRRTMGRDKIIGISTHSMAQFEEANGSGADYISFGPVFPTKAKDYSIGTADIKKALKAARKPVFFIGGINMSNMEQLLTAGCRNVAVMRAITEAEDTEGAARRLKKEMAGWR